MSGRSLAAVVLALAASGCARGFVCARKGGAEWRELRTDHFVLRTDHSARTARSLALELERIRDAVAKGLLGSEPASSPVVQVVVPRRASDFDLFAGPGSEGFFTFSVWGEPTIVFPGVAGSVQRAVIAHELVHVLTTASLDRQPPWFREGFAGYAESVAFRRAGGHVMLGDVARDGAAAAKRVHGNMREVLAERGALARPWHYGLAWLLVHFLLNEEPERLGALGERFERGEDPQQAWRGVFPEWDPQAPGGVERLEEVLSSYARKPAKTRVSPHRRLAAIPPPAERLLSPAEVHDLRLALPWMNRGRPVPHERMLAEAREALAEDPGTATAVALLSAAPGSDPRALAEAATHARPRDARTWVLLGAALPDADAAGREEAYRRAAEVGPESAVAHHTLTAFLLERGRARDALFHARRAAELAPWSRAALDAASRVLEALGDCGGALALQERAVDDLPERARDEVQRGVVERWDSLRASCPEEESAAP